MQSRPVESARFEEVMQMLRLEFPHLNVVQAEDPGGFDAIADIPAQPGLQFHVGVGLQNSDELHLSVGHFFVEWFPCGRQKVFDRYVEALKGMITGRMRIVEFYLFGEAVKAQLQQPKKNGGWETIATWSQLAALVPWKRERRVIRNEPQRR